MNTPIGQSTVGQLLPIAIYIVLLLLLLIFCIVRLIKALRAKKGLTVSKRELRAQGATIIALALHASGLPIAENSSCAIISFPDRVEFRSGRALISLERKKITDMCVKTEREIQGQYVSSVGGAVGGALLFGPLGAFVGGRPKKKIKKSFSNFLVITYKNAEDDIAQLGFNVSSCLISANRLTAEFNKLKQNPSTRIEL